MTLKSEPAIHPESADIVVLVSVSDEAWVEALPQCRAIASRAAMAAAAANAIPGPLEISILLAGDEEVRGLNRDYRKIDAPTNVLAFASGPPPPAPRAAPQAVRLLGDVVLAFGTMRREADERGLAMADHLAHLVVPAKQQRVVHALVGVAGHAHFEVVAFVRQPDG